MPEDAIDTQELKDKLDEAREAGAHAHRAAPWITWLSLSTAIVAVLAAIAALQSGSHANDAMLQKNDAVLHQSKADDEWAHYQAKGVEVALYTTQAESASRPELAARWRAESEREKSERAEIRRVAEEEEKHVAEMDRESEHSLHVHHQFATSVTVYQVAIALAAIAALARRKSMWWVSLAVGATGTVFFAIGLLAK
jgi:aminopeptidase N